MGDSQGQMPAIGIARGLLTGQRIRRVKLYGDAEQGGNRDKRCDGCGHRLDDRGDFDQARHGRLEFLIALALLPRFDQIAEAGEFRCKA